MARVKLVYLGGGSTRAAGTMASFMANGADFDGSEVVLVDLDPERLELIRMLADEDGAAPAASTSRSPRRPTGAPRSTAATRCSRRSGRAASRRASTTSGSRSSTGSSARRPRAPAASSWRSARSPCCEDVCARDGGALPGRLDLQLHEPRQHRRRGDHAQLAGQDRLALRRARSTSATQIADAAGLDPTKLQRDDGRPQPRLLGRSSRATTGRTRCRCSPRPGSGAATTRRSSRVARRQLQLAVAMGAIPADYFQYYYFTDEVLAEYQAKPTTRAEDILGWSTDYWRHYEEQAQTDDPQLDPAAHAAASTSSSSRST